MKLETLKEKIDSLDADEHTEIFKRIQNYTTSYTKTDTSVFISSDNMSKECLKEVEKLVVFYLDQRKTLIQRTPAPLK